MTSKTIAIGDRVETLIAAPHPAAFAGTVMDIGAENGGLLIRADNGIERVYTPRSVRLAAKETAAVREP